MLSLGLSKKKSRSIRRIRRRNPEEYLSKPRLLSMQGDVYMGGVKGLLHINCKIPLTTSELPQLQLSDVIINGESVNNN